MQLRVKPFFVDQPKSHNLQELTTRQSMFIMLNYISDSDYSQLTVDRSNFVPIYGENGDVIWKSISAQSKACSIKARLLFPQMMPQRLEWALNAIREGRTATLYVSKPVLQAILQRYWTPKRVEFAGLRPISDEEVARVKSDFKIDVGGYANSLECPRCKHPYSTYDFIQQGIKEHGEEAVRSTFSFKGGVFQINPRQAPVCQRCGLIIIGVGVYSYLYNGPDGRPEYACGAVIVIVIFD